MNRSCGWVAVVVVCIGVCIPDGAWAADSTAAHDKNHTRVKAAFRAAVAPASGGTVRVQVNGHTTALGTVVDADGYIFSKASVLEGKLICHFKDGRKLEARVIGVQEEHDLALLKVDADDLKPVRWRTAIPPPGSLVAAVGIDDDPLAIGVVSTEPRKIGGSSRTRGWLGITLGGGTSGLGITVVSPGSAAEKAGLKAGDRVKTIDGKTMRSIAEVVGFVGSHAPGATIKLVVERNAKEVESAATLGRWRSGWGPQDQWGGGPFSERRWGFPLALSHDAVVHPNKCGGPLVDTDGNAIGINIARALRVASYAIPADTVEQVLRELRNTPSHTRGDE